MIVLLAGQGRSTSIVANYLAQYFPLEIIVENSPSTKSMLKRRAKKLGWPTVFGQAIFIVFSKLQRVLSAERISALEHANGMAASMPQVRIHHVNSANECSQLLRQLSPSVVVVNGTRILSKQLLTSVPAPFINMHMGITPKYRGVHGAYWALARKDLANAGVTVHLVDPGIDTGEVLYQANVAPSPQDCFCTYPTLQLGAGLPLLRRAINDALTGLLRPIKVGHASELFYHPTIWQYLRGRLRGVR